MQDLEIHELDSIQFGISSAADIEKYAVCEITNPKLVDEPNTLYDKRMGAINSIVKEPCVTCNLPATQCPGHFGFIKLHYPILHPMYYKQIVAFLKMFCNNCNNLLYLPDNLQLMDLMKYRGYTRFLKILEKCEKYNYCFHCKNTQPKISINIGDGKNIIVKTIDNVKTPYSVEMIQYMFESVTSDQITLIGLDPALIHPRNLIMTNLPVLPPQSRPRVIIDGIVCDDDITTQYADIMKKMVKTKQEDSDKISIKIKTIFDNSHNKIKQANGRVFKGIKERISGKDGIVRMNLLGKRVDQSARTVIGPDSTLKVGEVGVPLEIAQYLSIPETVGAYNKHRLDKLVQTGDISIITQKNSTMRINLKYLKPGSQRPTLNIGDTVERALQNGDHVILNRQPTLHIGSIIANKVVILPGKNLRIPVSICKSLNADFDGDESNIHAISTVQGNLELELLASVFGNFMNPQNSTTNFNVVQDSLLAMFKMTQGFRFISHSLVTSIIMYTNLFDIAEKLATIQRIYTKYSIPFRKNCFDGKMIFSLMLPRDFCYHNADVKIEDGVLYAGVIAKQQLSGGQQSILFLLYKCYNVNTAVAFLDNIQSVSNEYFKWHSFTVGIEDCMAYKQDEIATVIQKGMIESEEIERIVENPNIREAKINAVLTNSTSIGMKIAKDCMGANNFIDTITAGSKGSLFNIAQITSLLGQQCIDNTRFKPKMYGQRTMPYYQCYDSGVEQTLTDKYESRGFISNSFINGLNPREFFLHACTGREGVISTSMRTASSGYSTRRLIKFAEDAVVQHDRTVRNPSGNIYQWVYGYDGLDPKCTILVDDEMQFCNVQMIVDKLMSANRL